ncbi:hypothetical protein RF55_14817 [Lasius niger]|uniref:Uncharacterized protein n=1 Tax=Lasius niger TaxID=67767 RepID=A0A0J7N0S5_LASNI|nr:hypothetical protein RF55_14817 [Lasius niger]
MDDKLNKSNESENIIMNKNNGKEIKSITNDEISGNIQIDKEIEEFKNVLEDGNDHLILNAWEEWEKEESYKKEGYKTEEFKKEQKIENKKRKEDNDEKKKKKHKKN